MTVDLLKISEKLNNSVDLSSFTFIMSDDSNYNLLCHEHTYDSNLFSLVNPEWVISSDKPKNLPLRSTVHTFNGSSYRNNFSPLSYYDFSPSHSSVPRPQRVLIPYPDKVKLKPSTIRNNIKKFVGLYNQGGSFFFFVW
jgi:hypothetical protein